MDLRADVADFLKDEMCIDVDELLGKINEPAIMVHSEEIYRSIVDFFDALSFDQAENKIQEVYMNFEFLHSHEEAHSVLDSLRHVFEGFAYGGLHQLYTRQENEVWYPKVNLVRELKPNDIEKLDEIVTIYRGCSNSEYQSKRYGQAWTTSKSIADMFAHKHYEAQPWFDASDRVVLKSIVPKTAVFYSKQSVEFEVVIDAKYLGNVEVCT